jgi:protein ImuB
MIYWKGFAKGFPPKVWVCVQPVLTWYRVDGKNGNISIGTNHPSNRTPHLFKLFFHKLDTIAPGLGIELFVLDAPGTEPVSDKQSELWSAKGGADSEEVAELLDRVAGRIGNTTISIVTCPVNITGRNARRSLNRHQKKPESEWRTDKPRPMQILDQPEPIEAMALTPDYPPKLLYLER